MERLIGQEGFDQGREELSDLVLAAGGGSEGETGKKENRRRSKSGTRTKKEGPG